MDCLFCEDYIKSTELASHKASKEIKPLKGQIALVTGGARGVGRGIALQLAEAGATIYVSGRKPNLSSGVPTLSDTINEISSKGGKAIAVYCDHSKDDEVKELFERIAKDENNRLDVLVNNAFSGGEKIKNELTGCHEVQAMEKNVGKKFFECQPSFWDEINLVGLRNVYVCSVFASRMMVPRQKGLIVNISSPAGIRYFFNVPYGVGKTAVDRMSADMAEELKDYKVTVISLWPGTVKTELTYNWLQSGMLSKLTKMPQTQLERMVEKGETPEFVGRSIACLACDSRMFKKTGSILLTGDLCNEYMFLDNDGRIPSNMRSVSAALDFFGFTAASKLIPSFLKVPATIIKQTAFQGELNFPYFRITDIGHQKYLKYASDSF
ncbi:oxidoreductase, short chain dehydrogenase/reductase family protein [Onchocerca flexuosa]|uniref:Oxidoreductase, short chain dehydrogenase/reductase family protein n=1 Tax=Onchocerca flexuosa TaxID=387005 RepID=A0A238BX53_9BILA|nr:oxidoreductase, short chain dehydrogenase/reductase family protein [Onchocerca flexuosa]